MGSQLQTSEGMKLATRLLLAGTIVVEFIIVGAKAKPQTVLANVHVSVGGRTDTTDTTGKCAESYETCYAQWNGIELINKECCRGLVCHAGLVCGPAKKAECAIIGEECHGNKTTSPVGELKACCKGLVCTT